MTVFRTFEEMRVWQDSRILNQKIRAICKQQNVVSDWSFVSQITRAARSISANIAEGSDSMTNPEFINFLGYAKRSTTEVRSHLYDARDEQYISESEFKELTKMAHSISRMLAKLIHHLQSRDPVMKRTFKEKLPIQSTNQR